MRKLRERSECHSYARIPGNSNPWRETEKWTADSILQSNQQQNCHTNASLHSTQNKNNPHSSKSPTPKTGLHIRCLQPQLLLKNTDRLEWPPSKHRRIAHTRAIQGSHPSQLSSALLFTRTFCTIVHSAQFSDRPQRIHITAHNPQPVAEQALLRKPIEVEVEVEYSFVFSILNQINVWIWRLRKIRQFV